MKNVSVYKILKAGINTYFEEKRISRYANRIFWIKTVLFMLMPVAGYYMVLAFGATSLLVLFCCYLLFNMGSTLFVVNVAHDATHQCISRNRLVNRCLGYSWNLMGISKYLWEIQHHRSHHNHTGIPHRDVDIDETIWVRYSPTHRYRPYYRYQHLYAPFLYLLFGIFVVFVKDFIMLLSGKLQSHGIDKLPRYLLPRLILTKLLYLFAGLIIPLLILHYHWWLTLLIYLLTLSISSGLMLVVLVMPHINAYTVLYKKNVTVKNQEDWVMHQLHANIDSAAENQWLGWLLGGLNTHLVHHLFPNICHIHYLQLTRVIKQKMDELQIPYKERNFVEGVIDHFKFLKLMGMNPTEFRKMSDYAAKLSTSH